MAVAGFRASSDCSSFDFERRNSYSAQKTGFEEITPHFRQGASNCNSPLRRHRGLIRKDALYPFHPTALRAVTHADVYQRLFIGREGTPAPDLLSHHLGESWDLTPSKPRSYKSSARISAASS